MNKPKKIVFFVGTRPEAIKVAPIIHEAKKYNDKIDPLLCITGQHQQMLRQALEDFNLVPDFDLNVMRQDQSLNSLCGRLFNSIGEFLDNQKPDWVIAQGDTTTVLVASLCSFFQTVKFGHVEAGLRSFDKYAPFPEEINRRVASLAADLHFAPTDNAKKNLLNEGTLSENIIVTGNTVVDALMWMVDKVRLDPPNLPEKVEIAIKDKYPIVLITGHRRENFGTGFRNICLAIRDLSLMFPDVKFVYPVHLNPNVQKIVYKMLDNLKNVILTEPLTYKPFVRLMDYAGLIVTDSGGVQEEGPSLGKKVLVMRDVTERPEGLESGLSLLVGTDRHNIVNEVSKNIKSMSVDNDDGLLNSPYGDGFASHRIMEALLQR